MKYIFITLGLLLLIGCATPALEPLATLVVTSTTEPAFARGAEDIAGSEQIEDFTCWPDGEITFKDWPNWKKVNPEPITGHGSEWAYVFVNELAAPIYLSASSPYPVCAQVVKPIYLDESVTKIVRMTVMVKMPLDYDPENGNWWYGVYDGSGTRGSRTGMLQDCIDCHKKTVETDYMFSREVTEASNE